LRIESYILKTNAFLQKCLCISLPNSPLSTLHSQLLILLCAFLLASCASPAKLRGEQIGKPVETGDYAAAIAAVEKNKKKLYNSEDEFLYEFDMGVLRHYNRDYKESIKHFAAAENILEDLYTRSVSNEAAALLTNDNMRPYRSYPFEIQWLHQTQILNYLALGNIDGAAVQSRRALLAIQSLKEKEESKFNESGALHYLIAISFEWQKMQDNARIAYNDSKKLFASSSYTPKLVKDIPENEQEIVVIGYAGISPVLGENKFWGTYAPDGALFLRYKEANGSEHTIALAAMNLGGPDFSGQTMTIQFAIPKMVDRASNTTAFEVAIDGGTKITEPFSNTKNSLKKDLENGQNALLLKTAGRVILRTIAASQAKSKMNTGNGLANLILNIGTDVATYAIENADLRMGIALPLTLQIARIPVEPGKHSVKIDILDGYGRRTGNFAEQSVNVKKGEKVFIFAPALR